MIDLCCALMTLCSMHVVLYWHFDLSVLCFIGIVIDVCCALFVLFFIGVLYWCCDLWLYYNYVG